MIHENKEIQQEEGVEIPYHQIAPETLRRMIEEYVSRDGADWGEIGCKLEDKVNQVLGQLKSKKVKVVFDIKSQTANLVTNDQNSRGSM